MRWIRSVTMALTLTGTLMACDSSESKKSDKKDDEKSDKRDGDKSKESESETPPPVLGITCKTQTLYQGPGEAHGAVIDPQASKIMEREVHSAVWDTHKVVVLDSKDDWSEIQIVEGPPKTGWIPDSCIDQ